MVRAEIEDVNDDFGNEDTNDQVDQKVKPNGKANGSQRYNDYGPTVEEFEKWQQRDYEEDVRKAKSNGKASTAGAKPKSARQKAADDNRAVSLISRRASDIKPEHTEWLWPNHIAVGEQTSLSGDSGEGKSQILIGCKAAITTGGKWPCSEDHAPLGSVILLSLEDHPAKTVVPRLIAAGADLSRVHIVQGVITQSGDERTFNLKHDLDALRAKIKEIGDALLVGIDPISAYLGELDSGKDTAIRSVLDPVSKLAQDECVAIFTVGHFNKDDTKKALHRPAGSYAYIAAPRLNFAAVPDPNMQGGHVFVPIEVNICKMPAGIPYTTETVFVNEETRRITTNKRDIEASRIRWGSELVHKSADEVLAQGSEVLKDRSAKERILELLGECREAMKPSAIAETLDMKIGTVKSKLHSLKGSGDICSDGDGGYYLNGIDTLEHEQNE